MVTHTKEELLRLYKEMLRIRLIEESFVEPILKGEIRTPCHLYSGQEAIAVGVCSVLNRDDYIFGNHRSHGHYLAKGGDMKAMAAEIFCRQTGCSRGRGGSMHLIAPEVGMLGAAPIVAGTVSLALGAALAVAIRKDGRVAVSFFGDGAVGEGVLHEALNFAALKKLPLIFACENNLYATHMPIRECRVDRDIADLAAPYGIRAEKIDGNDVLAVREAALRAVEDCRIGNGPVFLEFLTYRLRGHVGPDDNIQGTHTDIRPPEEIAAWRLRDPIVRLGEYLIENGFSQVSELEGIREVIIREVEEALDYAKKSPYPQPEEVICYVFA